MRKAGARACPDQDAACYRAPSLLDRVKAALGRVFEGAGARQQRRDRMLLARMCLGDPTAVDRLIAAECARAPGLSEAEGCRRAIQRIQWDNR